MSDPTRPLKISDKKEFERRQQAYNDSLTAYNNSKINFNNIFPEFKGDQDDLFNHSLIELQNLYPISGILDAVESKDLNFVWGDKEKERLIADGLGYNNIAPEYVLSSHGGTMENYFFTKPTQPVEYDPRESYQQIPTRTPTALPTQSAIEETLQTFPVDSAYIPPKDVRRFTAGNYLESQGLPSGYVNYGEGKGRKEMYADGGVRNTQSSQEKIIDSFYTPQQSALMGSHASYPYRTLQDPSLGDINISIPQYHDPNTIRELKLEKRLRPSNIPTDSSFRDINNNDIGTLFNQRFGIQ